MSDQLQFGLLLIRRELCYQPTAGLAETCSYIVGILFHIEDSTRINETLVCMQVHIVVTNICE